MRTQTAAPSLVISSAAVATQRNTAWHKPVGQVIIILLLAQSFIRIIPQDPPSSY